jgi:hypothetical protein
MFLMTEIEKAFNVDASVEDECGTTAAACVTFGPGDDCQKLLDDTLQVLAQVCE